MSTTIITKPAELIHVDADLVLLETNVRADVDTTSAKFRELVESVKDHGILTPALGRRGEDGTIYIRAGQRRMLAARETGTPLPVVIAERGTTESERIIEQLLENDVRDDLTQTQRVKAYAQLELEGLTVNKIAKATGKKKDEVEAALTVSKDDMAMSIADDRNIDLLHLAAAQEFVDDHDTWSELLNIAENDPEDFDNEVIHARRRAEERAVIVARRAELEAAGRLYDAETIPEGTLTAPLHQLRATDDASETPDIRILISQWGHETKYMVDYPAHGYELQWGSGGGTPKGPMSDEDKAARKLLIRRNKESEVAMTVRRLWLATFFTRKSFPKNCGEFVAIALTRHSYRLHNQSHSYGAELLGLKEGYGYGKSALADYVEANPGKAGIVTLALVLGQFESGMDRETWRHPDAGDKAYLLQLESWGYTLTPVEKIAAGYEVGDDEGSPIVAADIEAMNDEDLENSES